MPTATPPKEKRKAWPWIVGAVVVLLVLVGIAGTVSGGDDESADNAKPASSSSSASADDDDELIVTGDGGQEVSESRYGAFDVCKQFVRDRLKAPDGATWRDPFGDQVTYAGDGAGPITVAASVDSQNSFGAKLRSTYVCTVSKVGGDRWSLDDLIVNDGGDLGP
jgi:hypothetical protein